MEFSWFFKKKVRLRKIYKGYVLALTLILLPIILLGTKYIIDSQSLHKIMLLKSTLLKKSDELNEQYYKICAKEAALAVAKKWNPALTYKQQKASMLRIADKVYNQSPTCYDNRLISEAIPGVNIEVDTRSVSKEGGMYTPIKIKTKETTELGPEKKQIAYETKTVRLSRYYYQYSYNTNSLPFAWYGPYFMHNTYVNNNISLFVNLETDEKDSEEVNLIQNFCLVGDSNYPLTKDWYCYMTAPQNISIYSSRGAGETGDIKIYTQRKDFDDDTVTIECEDDKIKVITDKDIGYAVPAECNVDIVLAIPTNAAASNINNQDLNSLIKGTTYVSSSTTPVPDAKSTPVYQIAKAYRTFLKSFFYMKGVNVGVIPYSGNVSLPADGAFKKRSSWVKKPDAFVSNYFTNQNNWNFQVYDERYYAPSLMGAMLYGAKGGNSTDLSSCGTLAGRDHLYALLCRGDTVNYEGNILTKGNLLSVASPENNEYRRQQYDPCFLNNANLLSGKCEKFSRYHWANPYYILEMNPDLLYIYYMLSTFYPYYDDHNLSNFIFIPVTWCNNLFQKWNATGESFAIDTKSDSETQGKLSTPSKLKKGRKKVLILTVNKPDWFEPGELTYIGFDNDYSDTIDVESDTIRFNIDYSDSSRKYADDSVYDGTVQGQNKTLVFTTREGAVNYKDGNYQCSLATGRLTYPQKYLIELVVEPKEDSTKSTIQFLNIISDSSSTTTGVHQVTKTTKFYITPAQMNNYFVDFKMVNIKLISASITNRPFIMVDGKPDFGKGFKNPERSVYIDIMNMANDGKFKYQNESGTNSAVYGGDRSGNISETGIKKGTVVTDKTSKVTVGDLIEGTNLPDNACDNQWAGVCYGKGKFIAVIACSNITVQSNDGVTWESIKLPVETDWKAIVFAKGLFCIFSCNNVITSEDGITWKEYIYSQSLLDIVDIVYGGDGKFIALNGSNKISYSSDGINWSSTTTAGNAEYTSICYGSDKFVMVGSSNVAYSNNGVNWIEASIPSVGEATVCYGQNLFVIVGTTSGLYSYDGISWIRSSIVTGNSRASICYGGGAFFSVRSSEKNNLMYSFDGAKWEKISCKEDLQSKFVCYGGEKFIVQKDCSNKVYYCSMKFNANISIQYDDSGDYCEIPCSGRWSSSCYGNGKFVVVARGSCIVAYSETGTEWNSAYLPVYDNWIKVCYGNGMFVAMSFDRSVYSFDGINWYGPSDIPVECELYCYGGGTFVGVRMGEDDNRYAVYSRNGIDWFRSNKLPCSTRMLSVCCGNVNGTDIFLATGLDCSGSFGNGSTMYSRDGVNWNLVTQILSGQEIICGSCCCFGGNNFVILTSGRCFISEDAENWVGHPSSGGYTSNSGMVSSFMCYGDGVFIALATPYNMGSQSNQSVEISYVRCSNEGVAWDTRICSSRIDRYTGETTFSYLYSGNEGYPLPKARYYSSSLCYSKDLKRFIMFDSGGPNYVYCDVDVNAEGFNPREGGPGLTEWKEGHNLPNNNCDNEWVNLCYGKGKFVTVAKYTNVVAYSEDGKNWACSLLQNETDWLAALFAKGKYWLFSMKYVAISEDGINWVEYAYSSEMQYKIWSIAYGANMFVATYGAYFVSCSSDGIHWQNVSIDEIGEYYTSLCYGEDKFVTLGYYGGAAYSHDGLNWTKVEFPNLKAYKCDYGKDLFLVVGTNSIGSYSYDGINWSAQYNLSSSSVSCCDLFYGYGMFVLIGKRSGYSGLCAMYSHDGISWKYMTTPSWFGGKFACFGGGKLVMIEECGNIIYHCNFIFENELSSTTFDSSGRWVDSCYGNEKFVVVAKGSDKAAYSINGTDWHLATLPVRDNWLSVCYGYDKFVAISNTQSVYSYDGIVWYGPSYMPVKCHFICYGGGVFVGIPMGENNNNFAVYSIDGVNWNKSANLPCRTQMLAVCYGEVDEVGIFIATGGNAESKAIIYSYDGITWHQASNSMCGDTCCFTGDKFVIISGTKVYTSKNGRSWMSSTSKLDPGYIVRYGNGVFLGMPSPIDYGYTNNQEERVSCVYYSTNAINWTQLKLNTARYYSRSLCYSKELHRFMFFDSGGSNYVYCDVKEEIVEEFENDTNWCFYSNNKNNSTNHNFILEHPGNMFLITDTNSSEDYNFDLGMTHYNMHRTTRNSDGSESDSEFKKYLGAGLFRMKMPLEEMFYDKNFGIYDYKWEIKELGSDKLIALYLGATLPVNITLYHYKAADTGVELRYPYTYIDAYGNVIKTYDPTEAVKKVTQDACQKLKMDWGDNLKIYLIKFRAQNEYLHKITKEKKFFDYSYLNVCATDGKEPCLYNVNTEKDLKEVLSMISRDIKIWAEATDARNV